MIRDFKKQLFAKEHPCTAWPIVEIACDSDASSIRRGVSQYLSQRSLGSVQIAVSESIQGFAKPHSDYLLGESESQHERVLQLLIGIGNDSDSGSVVFSLDLMQHIYSCPAHDFVRYFDYIWYPHTDNIILFDSSIEHGYVITHDGRVVSL